MSTVSLISDIGSESHELARFRMRFKRELPDLHLECVKTNVQRGSISDAAFVLDALLPEFPAGSIHIVDVESDLHRFGPALFGKVKDQWVICANNGLLSLLEEAPEFIAAEQGGWSKEGGVNALLRTFLPMVKQLQEHGDKGMKSFPDIQEKARLQPVISDNEVRATVIFNDHFGNAITNLKKEDLDQVAKGKRIAIILGRHDRLTRISQFFGEAEEGDVVATWTEDNYLQIGIYHGDAARLLGLGKGKMITVELV